MSEAHANFGDFIPLLELIVMVYINKNVAIQYFFMYHSSESELNYNEN